MPYLDFIFYGKKLNRQVKIPKNHEPEDTLVGGQSEAHPDMKKIEALKDLVSKKADRLMSYDERDKDAVKGDVGVVAFRDA